MKTYLVTGAAGFIGANYIKYLLYKKYVNEDIKIMQIIADMEEMLNQASGFPLSKKVGVDRDEMLDLIDELKGALPYELDTALKIIKEQDSILESARNDADFLREEAKREREQKIRECNDEIIIKNKQVDSEIESMMKEATIRAEELVSESKINKDAKARSEKMIKEATDYSRDLRTGARNYSIEQLESVEATLVEILSEVRKGKSQL